MKILLDDTFTKQHLYPFTAVRNAADIRIGILTIREKWEKLLGYKITTELPGYFSNNASPVEKDQSIIVNANIVPTQQWLELILNGESAGKGIAENRLLTRVLEHPKDIFQHNDWALRKDFELITKGRISQPIPESNRTISPADIFIEEGAIVEHSILNASTGPVYIGKNAEILEGCMIRGPFALCEGATLKMGTKIYGATTIGPYCTAGGEIKNSIMFGYSNKAHDGYLGDSVIGEWCNLGAGTTNSNVKNTASDVMVWDNAEEKYISAGLKCGLFMGDYSRAAINTSFNTGTVVGICCNIFGESIPPKHVPDFTWGNEKYDLEKVLHHIDNWKKLKGRKMSPEEQGILKILYKK